MNQVKIVDCDDIFSARQTAQRPEFTADDYEQRISLLVERMREKDLTHVVIYGDREHFSSIEYFSSFDCRFEEGLYIIDRDGKRHIVVGNEGYGYSRQIPYEINRVLYQNFSLQGQPRDSSPRLSEIFEQAGIGKSSRVGVVGYKYFYPDYYERPEKHYDLPEYILDELRQVADSGRLMNFTYELTGLPRGIRMTVRTPKEIAWAEYNAVKCANVVLNLLEGLRVGIGEAELSRKGSIDFAPVCMYSLVNFGGEHLAIGLRSPDDNRLRLGDVCGLCYGTRGSLCSRTGVAAYDQASYPDKLRPTLESFYKPFWSAIAAWYETVRTDVPGGEVYRAVMEIIGGTEFGVTLNPGHNIGMDEWTNSPMYEGSRLPIYSGSYLQCDIIAASSDPVQNAICEDTVIVADEKLRGELKAAYPEVYGRITARQRAMRDILGIQIDDSVLPLSNLNGVYFPFLLNTQRIFAK